ncbi:MAG: beta-lactamase family protein [Bacteroidia bacterium]|nr:beta-lactamase family protein [Bacteroidia bacterium]
MKISLLHLLACLSLIGCDSKDTANVSSPEVFFSNDSKAASFTDKDRLEKLNAAFPVVDKIFKDQFEKNHFPAVAYGIVADGQLVYSNSFGISNIPLQTPATTKTDFRIASMSKSFTAVAILKLRDEGKLSLQDPVSKFIPEMSNVKYLTQDSRPITIEHLLTMSTGFPEDNPWGDRQLDDTDEELIELIEQGISFSNAPGVTFEYSNLGFGMLGKIVSSASGKPYQQYIAENILIPLGMNDARWEYSDVPEEQLAIGYRWEDEQWKEEPFLHDGAYGAMGGLICSIEDFSKYIQFHLSAWPPRNGEDSPILNRNSLREMHQLQRISGLFPNNKNRNGDLCPIVSGYGYGLGYRRDCNNLVSIRHGGGLPGFGSEWRFFPELGVGIVSLSNLTYGGLGSTNAKALDTLIYLANLKSRTQPVSPILLQRQKEIMELLPSWPSERFNILAENFFLDQSLESWKNASTKIFQEAGKIIAVNDMNPENQLRGYFVVECEHKNIEVYFTLTPEQAPLIQQLDLTIQEKR